MKECQVSEAQVRLLDLDVRIQVAVRLLGVGDLGDEVVEFPVELGIGVASEHVRSAFNPLVDVRVRPPGPAERPCDFLCRNVKVADASGGFKLLVDVIESLGAIDFEARQPEFVFNRNLLQREFGKLWSHRPLPRLRRFSSAQPSRGPQQDNCRRRESKN